MAPLSLAPFFVAASVLLSLGAPPLQLDAMAGRPPTAVSASLGLGPSWAPDEVNPGVPVGLDYQIPEGGVLSVLYCEDRATSFDLYLTTPFATAADLVAWAGVSVQPLVVAEQASWHVEWAEPDPEARRGSGVSLVRVLALRSETGWDRLTVDYAVPC